MPKYIARLEAQDGSGHYRRVAISAASEDAAREFLIGREQRYTAFQLDDAELAKIEKREEKGPLTGTDRANIVLHRQEQPYELVSLVEEKGA